MTNQLLNIFIVGLFVLIFHEPAQSQEYTISGMVHNMEKAGDTESILYIYLLTEETFDKPYTGIRKVEIKAGKNQNQANFEINNVKKGIYGLRCFQDLNNNGELDRFLIIPKEPWCLSWKNNKKSIPPRFEDISFKLNTDVEVDLFLDD